MDGPLRNRAREVDGGQLVVPRNGLAEDGPVRRDKVDDAVGEAGGAEDFVDLVVGEDGRVARLPHHSVALKSIANLYIARIIL